MARHAPCQDRMPGRTGPEVDIRSMTRPSHRPVMGQGRGASASEKRSPSGASQRPLKHRRRAGGTRRWHSPRPPRPREGAQPSDRSHRRQSDLAVTFGPHLERAVAPTAGVRFSRSGPGHGPVVPAGVRWFRSGPPGFSSKTSSKFRGGATVTGHGGAVVPGAPCAARRWRLWVGICPPSPSNWTDGTRGAPPCLARSHGPGGAPEETDPDRARPPIAGSGRHAEADHVRSAR